MILIRQKSSLDKECIPNFIDIISNDNALVIDLNDDAYIDTFNLSNIVGGITKQNEQYYYFEHDIVNTPRHFKKTESKNFSYKVYPITNDLVQIIIQNVIEKKPISKWEIFFNSFINYQKIYLVIKNYDVRTYQYSSYIEDDKLNIWYGISPSDYKENMNIEEFIINHDKKYKNTYSDYSFEINFQVLREVKLNEII